MPRLLVPVIAAALLATSTAPAAEPASVPPTQAPAEDARATPVHLPSQSELDAARAAVTDMTRLLDDGDLRTLARQHTTLPATADDTQLQAVVTALEQRSGPLRTFFAAWLAKPELHMLGGSLVLWADGGTIQEARLVHRNGSWRMVGTHRERMSIRVVPRPSTPPPAE